jgi:hypothetical protein
MKNEKTTAENLEARFDAGEDVSDYFDDTKVFHRNLAEKGVHRKDSKKNKNGTRVKRGVAKFQHA